jgi:hypothetical protein
VGVWLGPGDEALAETVLRRGPRVAALPADHALCGLAELDAEALAATPRVREDRVPSLGARLALVAACEGYAVVPSLAAELCAPGVAFRPLAGAGEWELRAGRPADAVPAVGAAAAIEALRAAALRERRSSPATAMLVARA